MWMNDYIRTIQQLLISEFGLAEDPNKPGIPLDVPDGDYPMMIEGKLDRVRVEDGKIYCCNY